MVHGPNRMVPQETLETHALSATGKCAPSSQCSNKLTTGLASSVSGGTSLYTPISADCEAPYVQTSHHRPTGRKSRPLITLSIFLKFGVAMSIGMYCLTYRAAENARLLSKQIVCLKIPSNTHEDIFQSKPSETRPTSLGLLLTPHQRNRQDPVASFCEDGEHRV